MRTYDQDCARTFPPNATASEACGSTQKPGVIIAEDLQRVVARLVKYRQRLYAVARTLGASLPPSEMPKDGAEKLTPIGLLPALNEAHSRMNRELNEIENLLVSLEDSF